MGSVSDGPLLFAKLKPGRYTVAVDRDGQVIHKTAKITGTQRGLRCRSRPQEQED